MERNDLFVTINGDEKNASEILDAQATAVIKAYNAYEVKEGLHIMLRNYVFFCNMHKDGSKLDKLWAIMPGTMNKSRMRHWLRAFTGWDIRTDGAGVEKFISRRANGEKVFFYDLEGDKHPFYEYVAPENKEDKAWDAIDSFKKWMDSARKKDKQGKVTPHDRAFINLISDMTKGHEKLLAEKLAAMSAADKPAPEAVERPALAA